MTDSSTGRLVARLREVTVLLDRFPALVRCDFDAYEGEVVFVQGPNGSGKTTLLRLLGGLVEAMSGSVFVFGRDPKTEARAIRREVSYLAHAYQMYEELSGRENLEFFAIAAGCDLEGAMEWARRLGLVTRDLNARFRVLSAGQRKKISAAIALSRRTELLLIDEPHALLDQATKATLDQGLTALAQEGKTIIVASHELDRISRLATRTYRMSNGTATLVAGA
ncbi:ATP-binding cassette domain-containing protein [Ferrimicrobium sp.]|uniref:ATP-binding cassette domain-containing protein n=1 Tax=Ferrimicrobium sp. TaxID=2926050 RepID=UPI002636DE29|nr:ATP-binding cassette domain-containing protein [Ferrimicrobium sp.]